MGAVNGSAIIDHSARLAGAHGIVAVGTLSYAGDT